MVANEFFDALPIHQYVRTAGGWRERMVERRGDVFAAVPGDADIVILPGSKATIADLAILKAEGWDIDIRAHRRRRHDPLLSSAAAPNPR